MSTTTHETTQETTSPDTASPTKSGTPSDRVWLTVQQAAHHAAVSIDTIYTACERAELQHTKVGGRRAIRIKAEWIDAWLEKYTRS
jgi:excisionase family DNA binding protein